MSSSCSSFRCLSVYSLAHFVVDFACAFLIFRLTALGAIPDEKVFSTYALYNLLAFGLESVFGSCLTLRTARLASAFGCILLMTGVLLGASASRAVTFSGVDLLSVSPNALRNFALPSELSRLYRLSLWSIICAGGGNALFHVGGGIDALTRSNGHYWRSGFFLAPGSLGLAYGGLLGRELVNWASFEVISGMVGLCGLLIWFACAVDSNEDTTRRNASRLSARALVLAAALVIIFTRSSVGFASSPLRESLARPVPPSLALACFAFSGKFLGGFLADLFSARWLVALSLLASIPMLCYCPDERAFLIGVFLLNLSTSATLVETARSYGGRAGVAFGFTTLALLFGYFTLSPICGILGEGGTDVVLALIVALLASSGLLAFGLGRKTA